MPSAYLLVSHGSSDPRPEIAMQQLAKLVSQQLPDRENLVGIAALELNPQPLHKQIQQFAESALARGFDRLQILPLFLLPGVHVMADIPEEVTLAKNLLSENIQMDLQPYLGSHPGLEKILNQKLTTIPAEVSILLAHGSRRPGSQQLIETLAASLGSVVAYWSTSPKLEAKVKEFVAEGYRQIAVLPYFLFPGGITDAIAQSVEELKLQFPSVTFQLAEPLGASIELAKLIRDLTVGGEKVFG